MMVALVWLRHRKGTAVITAAIMKQTLCRCVVNAAIQNVKALNNQYLPNADSLRLPPDSTKPPDCQVDDTEQKQTKPPHVLP